MKSFDTPTKTKILVAMLVATFLAAPVVVSAHFFIRMARRDYPPDADSIGIPVFGYWLFVFPVGLLFLIRGLKTYTAGTPLFNWNRRRPWRCAVWTALSLCPLGVATGSMILDGIQGRLYWVSLFFLLQLYCILLLRACVVCAGDHVAEPCAAPSGGPATPLGNSRAAEGPPSVS